MIFKVNSNNKTLVSFESNYWRPTELEVEEYLTSVSEEDESTQIMLESVFGEPLLFVKKQVRTSTRKRADILALDRAGNGVLIELKRDTGKLGVETQALQYLTSFANYRGKQFCKEFGLSEEKIAGFFGNDVQLEKLNQNSRIILVARAFDEALFSMGEWLSSKGVAFRCIAYTPIEIGQEKYLSFSVEFDRSPDALYQLSPASLSSSLRQPKIFWHNIANPTGVEQQSWWEFLVEKGQVPACFENAPGDAGERLLREYIPGDKLIAYASGGYGAVGWAIVEKDEESGYKLVEEGAGDDIGNGNCRHRRKVTWQATAKELSDGIRANRLLEKFSIHHPIRTSVSIDPTHGEKLIAKLDERFGNKSQSQ